MIRLFLLGFIVGCSLAPGLAAWADDAGTADDIAFFKQQIKPLLETKCYKCHGGDEHKGGLSLSSRAGLLKGGDLGPAVELDALDDSQLMRALRYEDLEMPPSGQLPPEQIELFAAWVAKGVPWTPGAADEVVEIAEDKEPQDIEAARDYWAYQPVVRPDLPAVHDIGWPRNAIDTFILARLESAQLTPAPPATQRALVRRLYYDLLGLPPTPEQVAAFEADDRPDAYERLVDALLSSPHYGEKWGRHWLDLVRYAETNGYERDGPKENVWRYRDYVINAFNQDKPYDRFVAEQIAGDELPDCGPAELIATGFHRLGIWDDEPADPVQAFYDSLDDVVSTTGQVFLGMTLGCARCHDHKIDPISQRDYYQMMAFFNNTYKNIREDVYEKKAFQYNTQSVIASDAERAERRQLEQQHKAELDAMQARIDAIEARIFASFSNPEKEDAKDGRVRRQLIKEKAPDVLSADELAGYRQQQEEYERQKKLRLPRLPEALTIRENGGTAPPMYIHVRGSAHAHGEQVEPGFPAVLTDGQPEIGSRPEDRSSGRRRVLAQWITSRDNPTAARVMANRLWQHHFGRGLVRTTNDFGKSASPPTHPQLLDWLAAELVESGWQIKAMHRLMLTSAAYQMGYYESTDGWAKDPENNLFWRFDMRRLTAEEVRDSILLLTGNFNDKMGGPSIYTEIPAELLQGASRPDAAWGHSSPSERVRRSVYVHVKRSVIEPVLGTFDIADTDSTCPVRFVTTVPTQALTTLNGEFFNQQAAAFADRLRREAGDDVAAQVAQGLRLALQREPTDDEIARRYRTYRPMAGAGRRTCRQSVGLLLPDGFKFERITLS